MQKNRQKFKKKLSKLKNIVWHTIFSHKFFEIASEMQAGAHLFLPNFYVVNVTDWIFNDVMFRHEFLDGIPFSKSNMQTNL